MNHFTVSWLPDDYTRRQLTEKLPTKLYIFFRIVSKNCSQNFLPKLSPKIDLKISPQAWPQSYFWNCPRKFSEKVKTKNDTFVILRFGTLLILNAKAWRKVFQSSSPSKPTKKKGGCKNADFAHRLQGCRSRKWCGRAPPPRFGWSVNPIQTRGHVMPTTLLLAPPDFQTFLRSCGTQTFAISLMSDGIDSYPHCLDRNLNDQKTRRYF